MHMHSYVVVEDSWLSRNRRVWVSMTVLKFLKHSSAFPYDDQEQELLLVSMERHRHEVNVQVELLRLVTASRTHDELR